jgi:hypothetical protein
MKSWWQKTIERRVRWCSWFHIGRMTRHEWKGFTYFCPKCFETRFITTEGKVLPANPDFPGFPLS